MFKLTEQQQAWREKIQEGKSEVLYPGTPKEISITPAEKIRFDENLRFGKLLVDDLTWLVSQESNMTVEEVRRRQVALLEKCLGDEQKQIVRRGSDRLIRSIQVTGKVGRAELLHRFRTAIQLLDDDEAENTKSEGEDMNIISLLAIPGEDIEVTSFGAIICTVRDQLMWEEIGLKSGTAGVTMILLDAGHLPARLRGVCQGIILIRDVYDEPLIDFKKTRSHELFHFLFHLFLEKEMQVAYQNTVMKSTFLLLKNELLARSLTGEWGNELHHLLNARNGGTNQQVRKEVYKKIKKEYVQQHDWTSATKQKAGDYEMDIVRLESELTRLFLQESKEFSDWTSSLFTASSLKELVYHAARLGEPVLDANKAIPYTEEGTVDYWAVNRFLYWVSFLALPIRGFDKLTASVRRTLESIKAGEKMNGVSREEWEKLLEWMESQKEKKG